MKNFLMLALVAVMGLSTMACSKVPAGTVGVKVHLLGGNKGVDNEVLTVGRYWIGVNEELYLFPTFQQNYVWTQNPHEGDQRHAETDESMNVQTKDNMNIGLDIGISYHVDEGKVANLFQKYREPIEEIRDKQLRNSVRDALARSAEKLTVEQVLGSDKEELLLGAALKTVQSEFTPEGVVVDKLYLVSSPRPPQNITDAINAKLQAVQMAQQRENELRQTEAEAKKHVAEAEGLAKATLAKATAEAQANQLKQRTLTKELIQYEAIQKWDGALPTMMGGSGAVPFINMSDKTTATK